MKVAFLNLCHCDPGIVERVARKLLQEPDFYMFIHVDKKIDEELFRKRLSDEKKVTFIKNRKSVSWGSFSAIEATLELMKTAVESDVDFDRYVLLQNLDYPIKSNQYIKEFFEKNKKIEFIRACKIAETKDRHFSMKYKLYHDYEDQYYRSARTKKDKLFQGIRKIVRSIPQYSFNGIIKDGEEYPIYYGAAQWAMTDGCVRYILDFAQKHSKFNKVMEHVQFPDEEYFHTIVHNSDYKYNCVKYDEPEKRWLVNWRNIHYFEYPKEIVVFEKKDFNKLMKQEDLFCRKVRSGVSDSLLDKIDLATR